MSAIGGPIESISLDGRNFAVAADADVNRKLGGFENEVQGNGDGSARVIMARVPWAFDGLTLSVDDDRGDHEYLQALADGGDFFPVAITFASGNVYQGIGILTGELQYSSQNSTAAVSLSGPGKLAKQ
jgi:hypothetical protein